MSHRHNTGWNCLNAAAHPHGVLMSSGVAGDHIARVLGCHIDAVPDRPTSAIAKVMRPARLAALACVKESPLLTWLIVSHVSLIRTPVFSTCSLGKVDYHCHCLWLYGEVKSLFPILPLPALSHAQSHLCSAKCHLQNFWNDDREVVVVMNQGRGGLLATVVVDS